MSEGRLLLLYFIMGLILGGTSGALYIVGMIKYNKVNPDHLRYFFQQLMILWVIIFFVVILGVTFLK